MAEPENSGQSGQEQRRNSPAERLPVGRRFQPGQSGNPGGRPKSDLGERIRKATADGRLLSDVLTAIVRADKNDVEKVLGGDRPKISERIEAVKVMEARGWGKAPQPLEHSGPEGGPLVVEVVSYAGGGDK